MTTEAKLSRCGYWVDSVGVAHICEGATVDGSVRIVWTLCGLDVPGKPATMAGGAVDCLACRRVGVQRSGPSLIYIG